MKSISGTRRWFATSSLAVVAAATMGAPAFAQAPAALRVAIIGDIANFDPHQFSFVNACIIKNLYDSLIEYTPDGRVEPSLATAWQIAPDSKSVTLTLRAGVKFHGGGDFNAAAVAANLVKAADPQRGKNLFPTMGFVQDWTVVGPTTIRLNFKAPAPERQVLDLLQFITIIDPAVIDQAETRAGGTGAFMLGERTVGQRIRLVANRSYWRQGQPAAQTVDLTVFANDQAATAALESGGVDLVYGGNARSAVRLQQANFQVFRGPGPLVQVFRINTTRGPFRNAKFRQAFNHLMDRDAILRVGYAGLGEVTALPWAPASPAADKSYNTTYAFSIDKARALLQESRLSPAEMSDWKLVANAGDQPSVLISQIVQATLQRAGINIQLDMKEGAELVDTMLRGRFDAIFGGLGNVQKFPSRVTTNSIYRTASNPVLGNPHPHPEYVAAIERVNNTLGSGPGVKAAYDHLNKVLVETAFAIPTNSYDQGLIVAARSVQGVILDMDNMLILRTVRR
jgi:peptide/nickel transport system substrate-binding protein